MIRLLLFLGVAISSAAAQVRQGGVYQILSESLDSGGVASSGGVYTLQQTLPALGALASGGSYTVLSGFAGSWGGTSTGAGPVAFLAWQITHFGGPSEPGAGPQDDPDFDEVPNLLEFAFNLPPLSASTAPALPGASGGLPWVREEEIDGARYFVMDYIRRKEAGLYLPEASTFLSQWAPAASLLLSGPTPVSGPYERVKLRLGPPLQPGTRVFYRLNVLIQ